MPLPMANNNGSIRTVQAQLFHCQLFGQERRRGEEHLAQPEQHGVGEAKDLSWDSRARLSPISKAITNMGAESEASFFSQLFSE